jgi:hypothetical protein
MRSDEPVLLPLIAITGIVAFIVTLPWMYAYAFVAALVAVLATAVAGAPVLIAARAAGARGLLATMAIGLVVGGAAATAAALVTEAVALRSVGQFVGMAAVIGGASGAIYGTVYDTSNLAPGRVRNRTLIIIAVALAGTVAVFRYL